jgi:hypothetical protein
MGLFNKLFGNKSIAANTQQPSAQTLPQKNVRHLTNEQKEAIEKSVLLLRTGQLFMHYYTPDLAGANRDNPEWQNKVMFFWKAEEPFPKKSLPPEFETFESRHFLFSGDTSNISLLVAQAMPWFGMPGLGEKHVCEINGQKVTVPELYAKGLIEYVEQVTLTENNYDILTQNNDYFFLIDEDISPFINGSFYIQLIMLAV